MATNVKFQNLTAKQLNAKQAAFVELFGQYPVIYARGIFTDTKGTPIFLKSSTAQVKKIGRKNITLWVNSDTWAIEVVPPASGAEYEFSQA